MREPWRDRRKRLEDLLQDRQLPRVAVVPITGDAPTLYETWVGMGGEGIVLKDPASPSVWSLWSYTPRAEAAPGFEGAAAAGGSTF
jgi:hypothetical protein